MMDFKEGEVLYFNKPLGWTSFKVVGHARYHICRRMKVKKLKVGHAGTLDPLATGVMIVCTGKATKRIAGYLTNRAAALDAKEVQLFMESDPATQKLLNLIAILRTEDRKSVV